MIELQIAMQAQVGDARIGRIHNLIGEHTTLEQLFEWGLRQQPPVIVNEFVQQDEFTFDVIVPFDEAVFLVFDVT